MKRIFKIFNKKHKKDFSKINKNINYDKYVEDEKNENKKASKALYYAIPSLVVAITTAIVLPITLKNNSFSNINSNSSSDESIGADNSQPGDSSSTDTSQQTNSTPESLTTSELTLSRLTTPKMEKMTTDRFNGSVSLKTYESYNYFANNFVSLCFEETFKKEKKDISLGVSIPDAYMAFAITAITSKQNVTDEFLTFMGLDNIEQLKVAVKEVISTLCTIHVDKEGDLSGGYNLNSLWFNPNKVKLLEKDEQLYKDLEELFDASIYMNALDSASANKYLADNRLQDLPTPEIKLDDDDPSAAAAMSVYYCLDSFPDEDVMQYQEEYESKNHKMNYTYDGIKSQVDYILTNQTAEVYEGEYFVGTTAQIKNLSMSYFLPDENVMPSSILSDVLNTNYNAKQYIDGEGNETTTYIVNTQQPYFKLDNDIEIKEDVLVKYFQSSVNVGGVNEKMVSGLIGDSIVLSSVLQRSVMSFDYSGFYSCSVTIATEDTTAPNPYLLQEYNLDLNRPYLFTTNMNLNVDGTYKKLPLVVGEIVNPNYE